MVTRLRPSSRREKTLSPTTLATGASSSHSAFLVLWTLALVVLTLLQPVVVHAESSSAAQMKTTILDSGSSVRMGIVLLFFHAILPPMAVVEAASGTALSVPSLPQTPTVEIYSNTEQHVSFSPPATDGGAQITSYTVEWDTDPGTPEIQKITTTTMVKLSLQDQVMFHLLIGKMILQAQEILSA